MFQDLNPLSRSTAFAEIIIMLLVAFILGFILAWILKNYLLKKADRSNNSSSKSTLDNKTAEALAAVNKLKADLQSCTDSRAQGQRDIAERDAKIAELQGQITSLEASLASEKAAMTAAIKESDAANAQKLGFVAVAADRKDDLTRISGIGPFIEKKLNGLGIYTFEQISGFTPDTVEKVTEAIEFFPGRIQRDEWIKQANELK